jgi:N-dimethylarginine dimethylaminohydrolase
VLPPVGVKKTLQLRTVRKHLVPAFTGTTLAALLTAALVTSGWSKNRIDYSIEPEYDRNLDRVVISLASKSKDLSFHKDIIESLPFYTEILVLLPKKRAGVIKEHVQRLRWGGKVRLVTFDSRKLRDTKAYVLSSKKQKLKAVRKNISMPKGTIWAQDLFEVVRGKDGVNSLLKPYMYNLFVPSAGNDAGRDLSDNAFIKRLGLLGLSVRRLPLIFKGGNVLMDDHKGRHIAFVGSDVIRETMLVSRKAMGREISRDRVVNQLRSYLNVDEVVVVGEGKKQPLHMFHLDQAMVLLPGGNAAVTRIVDMGTSEHDPRVSAVNLYLEGLRKQLRGLGYKIVDIEASVKDVLDYRYYVNGVPYVNRESGKREFLLPVFENSREGINEMIYKRNVSALEALGYRVIPVHTHVNEHHGGIHCMINVIS